MLNNKRFLITQPIIRSINGSTVVTLELAQELKKRGAKVTVYTCDYANPAKTIFKNSGIQVDQAKDNPNYQLSNFDYIWVHSQIIPLSIIKHLSKKLPAKLPSFIFLHMSGMDWIPDEKPWIYNLENQLSSMSLFICEEVENVNQPLLNSKIPTGYFRNPAPAIYKDRSLKPNEQLQKLLIVSSHPPEEVLEAKQILQSKYNIKVDVLGEGQEKYELFSKKLLEQYDAVLTIAKTVQYCLLSGTPVYVYDVYGGGPGWLNKKNIKDSIIRNFSGYQNDKYPNYEGGIFHHKTANQIVTELLNGYHDSLLFHQKHKNDFTTDFSIDSVLPKIFTKLKPRKITPFSSEYAKSVIAAELFATSKFEIGGRLYEKDQTIRSLIQEIDRLTQENSHLLTFKQNAEAVFNSKSYKLFDKAIKPYKKLKERNLHRVKFQ